VPADATGETAAAEERSQHARFDERQATSTSTATGGATSVAPSPPNRDRDREMGGERATEPRQATTQGAQCRAPW